MMMARLLIKLLF